MSKKWWESLHDLVTQATMYYREGNIDTALSLYDEAIQLSEQQGSPAIDLRLMKERLTPEESQDFSRVLNSIRMAEEYYGSQGEVLNQVDMLLKSAEVKFDDLSQYSEALLDLDRVEAIITSITPQGIADIVSKYPRFDATFIEDLLSTRRLQSIKLRKSIQDAENSSQDS
jgi:tetratricopeptide (TPR) repeat protein